MANQARVASLQDNINRPTRKVSYPKKADGKPYYTSEFFGENVFSLQQIAKALPKPAYASFLKQMRGRQALDKATADAIAHAVRIWAMDRGATHFTHWFQPQTGTTAEKHDAFLSLKSSFSANGEEVTAIDAFSGSQLLQAEPDASSFPSGGMRTTFEARGYTVWDTTSPMFIQEGPHGTSVLYIPSVFISYNGDALDEKTVLLRSTSAIAKSATELLNLIDPVPVGAQPKVAPQQFELAPIFEEASLAVDHNLLTMDVLSKVAHKNKLKVLYHEKPFKGVNGSGKHCNWSMSTDRGENLLDPTVKPETNYRFLLVLVSVLHAVQQHGGLLRTSIASSSNEHRLGACEAPPMIVSAFLGEHLTEVLNSIEESRPIKNFSVPEIQSIKLGGTVLDVKVASLPNISRDLTDRNRTSPFAFTGNKFEFRAVGSKQSPAFPVTILNAAVASAMADVTASLREQMGSKPYPSDADKVAVIKKYIASTKSVRFEGDGYSDAWIQEAEKRGLPNIKTSPEAFEQLLNPVHSDMLTKLGIFTATELQSRHLILQERYSKDLLVEANTLRTLLASQILPAAFEYRGSLAQSVSLLKGIDAEQAAPELEALQALTPVVKELQVAIADLDKTIEEIHHLSDDPVQEAKYACSHVLPALNAARTAADKLEVLTADKFYPIPKYSELLWF
ncbi:hypothetical protein BGX21_011148 [Mortierella sp. AD011]|nr:hypothetical protein BGX21_011148 [Mortierella sp. AD011]